MRPTILLTGKNGQIGSELARLLPSLGELVAFARSELDLAEPPAIRAAIRNVRPMIIVNAAAYTGVDAAETDSATAHAVNAIAPAIIADEAKRIGTLLVHYSTDYVFDGFKSVPYEESDAAAPLNAYGRTKLAGEQAIRDSGASHLIFRTSWVYGLRGRNFLRTVLRLAAEKEDLRIVCDQLGSPTWSRAIAEATTKALARLIDQDARETVAGTFGTYHMSAAGQTSWFEFARTILEEAASASANINWLAEVTGGRPLIASRLLPISAAEYPAPAPRPEYSVLSNALLRKTFGLALPHWRTQLRSMFGSTCDQQPEAMGSHA